MSKVELKDLFASMENQMSAQLSTNRNHIEHTGSKGDALENAWIEWLRKYLPNRYSVDKAIVIDYEGNVSHQIDVVIYDNWYTPFIFTQNGFHYIPAEGVYAIFEVKPDISGFSDKKHNIAYTGEKIESVRKLNRGSAKFINGGKSWGPRPLTKIVGGILTSTKSGDRTNNDTLIKHFKTQLGFKSIDIGCIADYGSFYIDYSPKSEIQNNGQEAYTEYYENRGYSDSRFSAPENSFVTFFMQLTRHLQQSIGTIPAINLNKYLENIGEKVDEHI